MATYFGAVQSTSTANFGANVRATEFMEQTFLPALRASTFVRNLGRESKIVENSGQVVKWNLMTQPAALTGGITEGGDPTDVTFTTTTITTSLTEFSGSTGLTKKMLKVSISATEQEIAEGLGYQAALTYDRDCLVALASTSVSFNAGASMTVDILRQAALRLEGGNTTVAAGRALPHPKSPGGAYFIALFSVEAFYDMIGEGVPTWSQAKNDQVKEAFAMPLSETPPNSAVYGCIIKKTSNIQRDTTQSPDDDRNFLIGADAFGVASLATNFTTPQLIRTPADMNVASLNRNWGALAWWGLFKSVLLDSNRAAMLLSDATGIG